SMLPPHPRSTLFPYTTLFRSQERLAVAETLFDLHAERIKRHRIGGERQVGGQEPGGLLDQPAGGFAFVGEARLGRGQSRSQGNQDRKSTRLNSSHDQISYAVF